MPLNEGDIILTGTPLGRVDIQKKKKKKIEIYQVSEVEKTIKKQGV